MKRRLFPSTQEAIITASIISFILGLCAGALLLVSDLDWKEYISSLATLISAFTGAWLAFTLSNRARIRQENEAKSMQLSKSLFVLLRQVNAIESIGREIELFPTDEKLAFEMPAYQETDYTGLKHDFDGLAFLASTKYAQELLNLTIEQERFEQVIEALSIRHKHYTDKVMPEAMESGLTDRIATLEEYRTALKNVTYVGALQAAKQIRSEVNAFRESSIKMHKRLHSIATQLYPKNVFVKIDI